MCWDRPHVWASLPIKCVNLSQFVDALHDDVLSIPSGPTCFKGEFLRDESKCNLTSRIARKFPNTQQFALNTQRQFSFCQQLNNGNYSLPCRYEHSEIVVRFKKMCLSVYPWSITITWRWGNFRKSIGWGFLCVINCASVEKWKLWVTDKQMFPKRDGRRAVQIQIILV